MSGEIGVDVHLAFESLFKLSRGTSYSMTSYPTESYFSLSKSCLGNGDLHKYTKLPRM